MGLIKRERSFFIGAWIFELPNPPKASTKGNTQQQNILELCLKDLNKLFNFKKHYHSIF